MARRGRRTNRVTIHTQRQTGLGTLIDVPTYSMGRVEAEDLRRGGELFTSNGKYYWSADQKQSPLSPVNLTSADMHGVVERRRRALQRVANWPVEHDRRSVTVIAGRGVWVPDAEAATMRAKLAEQSHRARRYADASRN